MEDGWPVCVALGVHPVNDDVFFLTVTVQLRIGFWAHFIHRLDQNLFTRLVLFVLWFLNSCGYHLKQSNVLVFHITRPPVIWCSSAFLNETFPVILKLLNNTVGLQKAHCYIRNFCTSHWPMRKVKFFIFLLRNLDILFLIWSNRNYFFLLMFLLWLFNQLLISRACISI